MAQLRLCRCPRLRVATFTWSRKGTVAYLRVWLEVGEVAAVSLAISYLGRFIAERDDVCWRRSLKFRAPRAAVLLHAWTKRVWPHTIIGGWAAGMKDLLGKPRKNSW